MKNAVIPTIALALALCACTTPQGQSDLAFTLALMDAEVPLAVAVVVSEEPETVGHFRAAAALIETMAEADTADPVALVENVKLLGMDPKAEIAVFGGIAIWRGYLARNPDATPMEAKLLLQVLARDIQAGLPPADVQKLRKAARRGR